MKFLILVMVLTASVFAKDRVEVTQSLTEEEINRNSFDAALITHRVKQLYLLNERQRRYQEVHHDVWTEKSLVLTIKAIEFKIKSGDFKIVVFKDKILQWLESAKREHESHRFNSAANALEMAEHYLKENFLFLVTKEAENLVIERRVYKQHSVNMEWPEISLMRVTNVLRSYHDGSLKAFGSAEYSSDPKNINLLKRANEIVSKISEVSGFNPRKVHVILTNEVSAYCLGNDVYLTKGLMDLYPNDGDLAMIVGHEIAHIVLKHGEKKIFGQMLPWMATHTPVVYALLTVPGKFINFVRQKMGKEDIYPETAGKMLQNLLLSRMSKTFELEADYFGTHWAFQAFNWDPYRTTTIWKKLYDALEKGRIFNAVSVLLHQDVHVDYKTHPSKEQRIKASGNTAKQISKD